MRTWMILSGFCILLAFNHSIIGNYHFTHTSDLLKHWACGHLPLLWRMRETFWGFPKQELLCPWILSFIESLQFGVEKNWWLYEWFWCLFFEVFCSDFRDEKWRRFSVANQYFAFLIDQDLSCYNDKNHNASDRIPGTCLYLCRLHQLGPYSHLPTTSTHSSLLRFRSFFVFPSKSKLKSNCGYLGNLKSRNLNQLEVDGKREVIMHFIGTYISLLPSLRGLLPIWDYSSHHLLDISGLISEICVPISSENPCWNLWLLWWKSGDHPNSQQSLLKSSYFFVLTSYTRGH